MLVKEAMTRKVITIDKNETILEASNMYKDFKIGSLIVTDVSRARPELSKRFIDSWIKLEWLD